MIEKYLTRNAGHPWDGRPGFDLLGVTAKTDEELTVFIEKAALKFWSVWIAGYSESKDGKRVSSAVLYKPCGQARPWGDTPEKGVFDL